jgi:hypothetical protein
MPGSLAAAIVPVAPALLTAATMFDPAEPVLAMAVEDWPPVTSPERLPEKFVALGTLPVILDAASKLIHAGSSYAVVVTTPSVTVSAFPAFSLRLA